MKELLVELVIIALVCAVMATAIIVATGLLA